jgi:hypothetical protein
MSALKICELAALLGLPVLAFFSKSRRDMIWRLWFAVAALTFLLVLFAVQR